MNALVVGIIVRLLSAALAGVLLKRGYDADQQRAIIEPIANMVGGTLVLIGTTVWSVTSRKRTVATAVEATKRATLDQPYATETALGDPAAHGRLVVLKNGNVATADPLKPTASRSSVTLSKLLELRAAERAARKD